eukprot:364848-Chlamydomonas_euryale.AAC.8
MRGPERLPHVKPRRDGLCTKHLSRLQVETYCAEAGGLGAFRCMHILGLGLALGSAGVAGRDQRPRHAYFVQG